MNTPLRLSPLHDLLRSLSGNWRSINDMPALMTIPNQRSSLPVHLADLSFLTRFGVKGAHAAAWLISQAIPLPDRPNTWQPLSEGGVVARLGVNEFLIEDSLHSAVAPRLAAACQNPPAKVYPVLRQDAAIALGGVKAHELLRQTCSFNFQSLLLADYPIVLTSTVGVAVIVMPRESQGQPYYQIWCDGTFGVYLWRTLLEIAEELGGGAIGAEQFMQ